MLFGKEICGRAAYLLFLISFGVTLPRFNFPTTTQTNNVQRKHFK